MIGASLAASVQRGWGAFVLAAAATALLAGCGSSASSAERTRITNEFFAQLKTAGLPSDLVSCVAQESRGLPLASVRKLAGAGSNPPASTAQAANRLLATCVAKGKGVASLRGAIVRSMQQSERSEMPAALTTCLEQKVNATRPSQLASLLFPASATDPGAAQGRGRQFGTRLAEQCLAEPAIRPVLLGLVLGPVERDLNASHYSTVFKSCLLGKVRKIASSELLRLAGDPAAGHSFGIQFGRNAADACIASGAKP